jgi:hypothetical protein
VRNWFQAFAFFKLRSYRYTTGGTRRELIELVDPLVGLALFTTLFCSQNTVQLMTVRAKYDFSKRFLLFLSPSVTKRPCNQADTRE